MATLTERRPKSLNSRTASVIDPGSRAVASFFGDKKLSSSRDRYADNLFRSVGFEASGMLGSARALGESMSKWDSWDRQVAASINSLGSSFRSGKTGAKSMLSKAVAHRNTVVSNNTQAIAESQQRSRTLHRSNTRDIKHIESACEDKEPLVDSKALATEIENVAAELRGLMAGMESDNLGAMNFDRGKDEEDQEKDDEDECTSLHARLLRYRYVRKIEPPPPPLEPLDEKFAVGPRNTDMMDRNLQRPRILWLRKTQERARYWNRETYDRIATASSRREVASEEFFTRVEAGLLEKDKKVGRVEAIRAERVQRLRAIAASREERLEQLRYRQEEERLEMERRVQAGLPPRERSRERSQDREHSPTAVKRQASPRAAGKHSQRTGKNNTAQMNAASDEIPDASAPAADTSKPPADEDTAADECLDLFEAPKEGEDDEVKALFEAPKEGEDEDANDSKPKTETSTE